MRLDHLYNKMFFTQLSVKNNRLFLKLYDHESNNCLDSSGRTLVNDARTRYS